MRKFIDSYWLVLLLLAIIVSLGFYIRYTRKESPSNEQYIKTIDSLKNKIKSNEEIYKNAINNPILYGREWDSLRTTYEAQTDLQRFRDSLELALSKKHPN